MLLPHLEPGDVVLDGGNSNDNGTERRVREYGAKGILFVGCGVSGGERGALPGPSLMPGGHAAVWPPVRPVFEAATARAGVPIPAMGAAFSYYDAVRNARLPANLLQAQRDYFDAHTYERTDAPQGQFFHTDWTGEGGITASTQYAR